MISHELIKKVIKHYKAFENEKFVVSPSLPILYFGDLSAYADSKVKILTVGKNPSDNEFRLTKKDTFNFVRFPMWDPNKENLIETLNAYFEVKPLKQWFSSFEPILNGMNGSYYSGKHDNIALHTDICSPLATSPTWSRLTKTQQEILFTEGYGFWKQLIEELQPDIMLVSVPRSLFQYVFKSNGKELISFDKKKNGDLRQKPYQVTQYDYILKSGKHVVIIFGSAANKPFDTITNKQKYEIGSLIILK